MNFGYYKTFFGKPAPARWEPGFHPHADTTGKDGKQPSTVLQEHIIPEEQYDLSLKELQQLYPYKPPA